MNSRLLVIPLILATATAIGADRSPLVNPVDAQAQAAALLSTPHASASGNARDQRNASSQSVAVDAHAHAAALLSGLRTGQEARTSVRTTASRTARKPLDAQGQAAALLSGSRITVSESAPIAATSERFGEHPAVLVAHTWSTRGMDPNTFIVAHPARLQLIAASPSQNDEQRAQVETTASTDVTRPRRIRGLLTGTHPAARSDF